MKNYTLGAAFVTAMLFAGSSSAEYVNPIAYPQSGDPTDIQVVIEIPAGTFTKYEIDGKTGLLFVDRFQSMPVVYPTNYGSIPSTVGPDGDPLDALVITRQPIYSGALILVRPVGILKMIDDLPATLWRTVNKKPPPLSRGGGLKAEGTVGSAYQSTCARMPKPLMLAPSLPLEMAPLALKRGPPSISDSL